ncbi:MAG: InlB B-repeat-containing protein [Clostridiales bacterium]|nr:InlB B-repeat-containing protein [Clostridiales bacterium]
MKTKATRKTTTPKSMICLLIGAAMLAASFAGIGAFRKGGGVSAAAGDAAVTVKLNGGGLRKADGGAWSTNKTELSVAVPEGRTLLTTQFVQDTLFKDGGDKVIPLLPDGGDDPTPDGGEPQNVYHADDVYKTPLLKGLFVDTDADGELDEGETLYENGDAIDFRAGMTLTCYYYDVVYYGRSWGPANISVTIKRAWKETPWTIGERDGFTARELQPFYHAVTDVSAEAFKMWNAGTDDPSSNAYARALKKIELPRTVTQLCRASFQDNFELTELTGLEGIRNLTANGSLAWDSSGKLARLVFGQDTRGAGDQAYIHGDYHESYLSNTNNYAIKANVPTFDMILDFQPHQFSGGGAGMKGAPWIAVPGATLADPKVAVYVPSGVTNGQSWYTNTNFNMKLYGGGNGETDTGVNMPIREFYSVSFNLGKNVPGFIHAQYQDIGAKSFTGEGTDELVVSETGADGLAKNPAAADKTRLYIEKPADPVCPNKTFTGWRDQNDYAWTDDDFGSTGKTLTEHTVLTAQWTAEEFTLNLNLGDGEVSENPTAFTVDELPLTLADAESEAGLGFGGWYTQADGAGDKVEAIYAIPASGTSIDVWPNWTDAVTLTFRQNAETSVAVKIGEGVAISPAKIPAPIVPAYMAFDGWYSLVGAGGDWGDKFDLTADTFDTDTDLYAKYIYIQYVISFDFAGGTPADTENTSIRYTAESLSTPIDLLAAPSRGGDWDFLGWFASEDAENDAEAVTSYTPEEAGSVRFYARWEYTGATPPAADPNEGIRPAPPAVDPEGSPNGGDEEILNQLPGAQGEPQGLSGGATAVMIAGLAVLAAGIAVTVFFFVKSKRS